MYRKPISWSCFEYVNFQQGVANVPDICGIKPVCPPVEPGISPVQFFQSPDLVAQPCYKCGPTATIVVREFVSGDIALANRRLKERHEPIIQIPNDRLRVVRCTRCGLVYQDPRPTANALLRYYDMLYAKLDEDDGMREFEAYRHRTKVQELKRLGLIHRWVRPPGRLLDIGCGHGYFLLIAKECGWQVAGVEISETGSEYARRALRLEVLTGELAAGSFPEESFDVVTMNSVLEHVLNPMDLLRRIARVLKPGGWLFFNVPNTESLELRLTTWLMKGRYGWYTFEHLHYYNAVWVRQTLTELDFKVRLLDSFHLNHNPYNEHPRPTDGRRRLKTRIGVHIWNGLKYVLESTRLGSRFGLGNIICVAAQSGAGDHS